MSESAVNQIFKMSAYHSRRPLLGFTLPTKPRPSWHSNDPVARYNTKNTNVWYSLRKCDVATRRDWTHLERVKVATIYLGERRHCSRGRRNKLTGYQPIRARQSTRNNRQPFPSSSVAHGCATARRKRAELALFTILSHIFDKITLTTKGTLRP